MAENITSIAEVALHFAGGRIVSHIVPASELAALVEASKRLHHSPGINPHNGAETAKIWKITTRGMYVGGPYWWSTPDLHGNGDPAGARIINWESNAEVVFVDEESDDYKASQQAEADEAEREHQPAELAAA